jgi:4-amino-4-deoxy-L-arabinose transferase-like glycosyltransferase
MHRRLLALLLIVAAGIGVRMAYVVTTDHSPTLPTVEGEMAHNIVANGRWFARNEREVSYVEAVTNRRHRLVDPASIDYDTLDRHAQWRPEISKSVGAGVVIAGIWAITGDERYIQVQVLQGIIDGLTALLVYWIARQLFTRVRPALIAAALYACYPPLAWQTLAPYDDIWAVDFTIGLVALYLVILKSDHRWRWLIAFGLLSGIGAYFRPQVLLIAPAIALGTVMTTGWREAFRRVLATTLIASLLLVPWTIRNYNHFHTFIPFRSGFWETMWGGIHELPYGFSQAFNQQAMAAVARAPGETPEHDSYFKPYVLEAIERHPLHYIEVLVHRVAMATVLTYEYAWMHRGAQTEAALFSGKVGVQLAIDHPLEMLEYALQPLVFLLAILSLGFVWRRWRYGNRILAVLVLSVLLPYIATHVEARYLLPAAFAYFIWIGLGVDLLLVGVERRRAATRSQLGGVTARPARRLGTEVRDTP